MKEQEENIETKMHVNKTETNRQRMSCVATS